jgi:hypothetical protein
MPFPTSSIKMLTLCGIAAGLRVRCWDVNPHSRPDKDGWSGQILSHNIRFNLVYWAPVADGSGLSSRCGTAAASAGWAARRSRGLWAPFLTLFPPSLPKTSLPHILFAHTNVLKSYSRTWMRIEYRIVFTRSSCAASRHAEPFCSLHVTR